VSNGDIASVEQRGNRGLGVGRWYVCRLATGPEATLSLGATKGCAPLRRAAAIAMAIRSYVKASITMVQFRFAGSSNARLPSRLFSILMRLGLNGLKINHQLGNQIINLELTSLSLGIESPAPNRHIAQSVSHYDVTGVDIPARSPTKSGQRRAGPWAIADYA
jgi:hypothetical protein